MTTTEFCLLCIALITIAGMITIRRIGKEDGYRTKEDPREWVIEGALAQPQNPIMMRFFAPEEEIYFIHPETGKVQTGFFVGSNDNRVVVKVVPATPGSLEQWLYAVQHDDIFKKSIKEEEVQKND